MAANSTKAKPKKPYPDFPLFPHDSGRWAKKIKGRLVYFGRWGHRRNGALERVSGDGWQEALDLYQDERDDLFAGRTPRSRRDDVIAVGYLCNKFLTQKKNKLDSGEIVEGTFKGYYETCKTLVEFFGRNRAVSDLAASDFGQLRASLAKTRGLIALHNKVTIIRMVFKFGCDEQLIKEQVRFGQSFDRPAKKTLRREKAMLREQNGKRLFTDAEIRKVLDAADQPIKAMTLLAINGGFGQSDLASLTLSRINDAMESGWLDYPRVKTGVERRCCLWPETIKSVKEAIAMRSTPKDPADVDLAFLNDEGGRLVRTCEYDGVTKRFSRVLCRLGIKRRGLSFYALRHSFATIGERCRDIVAVRKIMGHEASNDMSSVYRQEISDERLQAVTDTVRAWLFDSERTRGHE